MWVGILLLSLYAAAYLAEILRGGIQSISASQFESARAVGFTTKQTYRYVVLPQVFRRVLPAIVGQLANLVKDSAFLSVIGIEEFFQASRIVNAANYTALEGYLPVLNGYLILTLPMFWWANQLERSLQYED